MIDRPRILHSRFARHGPNLPPFPHLGQLHNAKCYGLTRLAVLRFDPFMRLLKRRAQNRKPPSKGGPDFFCPHSLRRGFGARICALQPSCEPNKVTVVKTATQSRLRIGNISNEAGKCARVIVTFDGGQCGGMQPLVLNASLHASLDFADR
jgi:hypothetical protein